MLKMLAGRSPVVMNVLIQDGIVVLGPATKNGFIYGNTFERRDFGIAIESRGSGSAHIEGNIVSVRAVPAKSAA